MHTIGVEVTLDPDHLHVWGFCPYTVEERLEGTECSQWVQAELPPEPLPRPYKHQGVFVIPCQNCSGSGRIMTSSGYRRPVRCPKCAGTGHGPQVSSTYPWFRWNDLPKLTTTGLCVVELEPVKYKAVDGDVTTKRFDSGKLTVLIDFEFKKESGHDLAMGS